MRLAGINRGATLMLLLPWFLRHVQARHRLRSVAPGPNRVRGATLRAISTWWDGADWRAIAAGGAVGGVCGWLVGGWVLAVLGVGYTCIGLRAWRGYRDNRRDRALLVHCGDALAGFADDVQAGASADAAFAVAARRIATIANDDRWLVVASAVGDYGDTAAALRAIPGALAQPSRRLASMWQLVSVGIPLVAMAKQLEAELNQWRSHFNVLAAETAAASATATVLACLPFIGVSMGYLLGANPLHILLYTPVGAVCAGVGAVLQLGGWAWARRIASAPQLGWS